MYKLTFVTHSEMMGGGGGVEVKEVGGKVEVEAVAGSSYQQRGRG